MNPIDMHTARLLLDMSGGQRDLEPLGDMQLEGAVALQNHLADPEVGLGYLADEVGMGKTYVALAVVAMMRYFNPMLRVLYLCPSRNVQEKWVREYEAFVRHNVKISTGRIRTRDGRPAVPMASCRNVESLIRQAGSGYFADFFIGKDSFSMHLNDDPDTWKRKLEELRQLVPAREWKGLVRQKSEVKDQYADVLNYILPTFDLVVIDEAHNFKHDFESSDRNRVLSRVLGFQGDALPRVKQALLLSATPYDRDIRQLRNQLRMVGKEELLPDEAEDAGPVRIRESLKRFMVRRLNVLEVNDEPMTRNRYRREWRKGERAEISLESDEQKLVMALVQKKVGEMLSAQTDSPSFQTGLLASFESFAQSARSEPVRFDGEQSDKQQSDARDRHVLEHIVESYVDAGLGRTLPHPKMDTVTERLCQALYEQGRKQIVFVRRVRSVNELKAKLDEGYNDWLHRHICSVLAGEPTPLQLMQQVFDAYQAASRQRDEDTVGGELEAPVESEKALPPKNDSLFAWFYRGEALPEVRQILGDWPTPDGVRTSLASRNRVNIILLEHNWAENLCERLKVDLSATLTRYGPEIRDLANRYFSSELKDDHLAEFHAAQAGFIAWLIQEKGCRQLHAILTALGATEQTEISEQIDLVSLKRHLRTRTLYSELSAYPELEAELNPWQRRFMDAVLGDQHGVGELRKLSVIHGVMLGFLLRTGHGIVDVYLARLKQGQGDLNEASRRKWMRDLVSMLVDQRRSPAFSTYHELERLGSHLEIIIRNNIPDILHEPPENYRRLLSRTLNPVSPIIGASGETGDRSPQARKFRMPGYPLALISTDVFQEGEDLHTFCDSVVHYGVSASPISLEQKSGRVDRVNSMAQRRLQSLKAAPTDEDFIQVTFPFVRESIESLQIRSVCRNINEYLLSLHEFSDERKKVSEYLATDAALEDRQEIPGQIMDQLQSPYDARVVTDNGRRDGDSVKVASEDRSKAIAHVTALLEAKLDEYSNPRPVITAMDQDWDGSTGDLSVCLKSARASGELLASLTRVHEPAVVEPKNSKELIGLMERISWRTFSRTLAIDEGHRQGAYRLLANCEMLVGDESLTDRLEIDRLFERMDMVHNPEEYSPALSKEVVAQLRAVNGKTRIPIDRQGATKVKAVKASGGWHLRFTFTGAHQQRQHYVHLYECDGRCIFLSRITENGYVRKLPVKDIVHYTWARNRHVDLVEFLVNGDGAIMGRVVHPLGNLQWEEFIYCAYTLAVETDTLEYLLRQEDRF